MTREEHLSFCENCDHKEFNLSKGIICKLTGEKADFEGNCLDFSGNRAHISTAKIKAHFADLEKKRWHFLKLLIPGKQLLITPLIFYACLIVFLAMTLSGVHILIPEPDSLIKWGGNFKPLTLEGEYWRMLSCLFIHAGIIHLVFNMLILFIIGYLLEPLIGWLRFTMVYFVSGLGGSIVSLWWNSMTVAIGASGAIFGLYGVFIALIITKVVDKNQHKDILVSLIVFLVYNLINGLKPGIDMAAHVGGLITGFISGFALFPVMSKKYESKKNNFIFTGSLAGLVILVLMILFLLPNPFTEFYRIMHEFDKTEQKALSFYRLSRFSPKEKMISVLNEEGIPNWEKCIDLLDETNELKKLPGDLVERVELIRKYCEYRIETYKLLVIATETGSNRYDNAIITYNDRIELILSKLHGAWVDESLIYEEPEIIISETTDEGLFEAESHVGVLYVIDGVPLSELPDFNPEDIHLIEILKDKSAEAIYGERGKNGVILITTKENISSIKSN